MRFQNGEGEITCLSQKEECNRMYTLHYDSPLGGILLAADEAGLTGLWFEGEKYFANILGPEQQERETSALQTAKRWLEVYFSGREPDFTPPLHPVGSPFRRAVWELLLPDPLRPDHDLRRAGTAAGCKTGQDPDVSTGSRRGGRPQ